jgi:protein-L-isoaspartate(D-aspartate) O-methyltransferase
MDPFVLQRELMVHQQLEKRGLRDPRVLTAMRIVPRHLFVDRDQLPNAYADEPLPIAEGQTISQPYVVARMLEAAMITSSDRVLEVGTGSGYAAAVASVLARDVFTVERHEVLARAATERLARLEYLNVFVKHGDGMEGWHEHGPYDVVLVPAAPATIPLSLLDQLVLGGRLIIPVGPRSHQKLLRVTRKDTHEFEQQALETVHFVPLLPGVTRSKAA